MRSDPSTRMLQDLKAAGLKLTPQRRAIVRLFAHDVSHPTAQELYERLLPEFRSMSFATVYNTLDALSAAGLSSTLHLTGTTTRFDPNTRPHHHAVCESCGTILDIPADTLAPTNATASRLADEAGFVVRSVERVYRGLCAKCAR